MSLYQRSFINEPNLTATPWWELKETSYESHFKLLEDNWLTIQKEALAQINEKNQSFISNGENRKQKGDWKQFNLYLKGKKIEENCKKTPITCKLIESIEPAKSCTRGQIKFLLILPEVHVYPHCGPTNCRLRAHLGLKIPGSLLIRVSNETREYTEGKVIVFDDSFEHEIWHKNSDLGLVLIIDFWHPELSETKRKGLGPI